MNYGYASTPSWPASTSIQQPAASQHPWYAPNSNSMQPVMQQTLQEELPPLPRESPPPLPDEPPPPLPQQQYSQPSYPEQNTSINMGLSSTQGSYMQQWGQHSMQQQYAQGQFGQPNWQGHVTGMSLQQHWGYAVPEQPGMLATGGQQPVLQASADQGYYQHPQYHPQHSNSHWQYPQQHQYSVPYQWPQQPMQQQQYNSSTNIGQQPPPPPRPPHPIVTAAAAVETIPAPMQQPSPVAAPAVPAATPLPEPVNLQHVLSPAGRTERPKRLLLILRGLPGSGKSHIAKTVKQLEVANSGTAPRVHSIDDYFMVDVEREVAVDTPNAVKSAGSKRRVMIEQEYQHDAAMEDSYWRSLLKAVGKTLSSGGHSLVLLDAPAPRADQVKEAWLLGESVGYEVMVVEPLVTDPEECHKQNIHGRSLSDIQAMAAVFEPAPSMYTRADASSLFKATNSDKVITDVDMAVEDAAAGSQQTPAASTAARSRWEAEGEDKTTDPAGEGQQEQGTADKAEAADTTRPSPAGNSEPDGEQFQHHAVADHDANRPAKRHRPSVCVTGSDDGWDIDNEALLAGVNQALEQLDAEEAAAAAASDVGGAGGADVEGGRGRRIAGEVAGLGTASSMSLGGSHTSGSSKGGILKGTSTPGSIKKKVTWPDLPPEEEQQSGFRIAPTRRQLEEVYWVDGLGPPKTLWLGGGVVAGCDDEIEGQDDDMLQYAAGHEHQQVAVQQSIAQPAARSASAAVTGYNRHSSFADQVRAEHKSEHDMFRAVLLGQVNPKHNKPHLS